MGHCINKTVIEKNANRKAFLRELDEYVSQADYEEGGCYPASQLTWHEDRIYDTREDAEEAIRRFDKGFYSDHAVLFRDTDAVAKTTTKQHDTIVKRIDTLSKQREEYVAANHADCRKSAYIGCPSCGSKLRREYLMGRDKCPVCGGELRSETVMGRIASYDARIKDAKKQLKALDRKHAKRVSEHAPVKWLVKWEYHC